jgi:peptidoglycan/xylan/chitin deacetylase (PgdA/CDA1 family)
MLPGALFSLRLAFLPFLSFIGVARGLALPISAPPSAETARPLSRPISRVTTREPAVAITFDACATKKGNYGFDRDVFEILKREQVPATIFVSGRWVDTHPDAMAQLSDDPLIEFGDHSYDHPHMTKLPAARFGEEIDQTEAALGRYGRHSVAFRPPFGDWNRRTIALAHEKNLPTVTWDVVSGDPSLKTTTAGEIRAVLAGARTGSIIIFHINGRGWKTHEALPAILSGLRERGFRFVLLSELMRQGGSIAGPIAGAIAGSSEGSPAAAPGEALQSVPPPPSGPPALPGAVP